MLTFQLTDIPTLIVLIFLELLLSSDNALVLAVLSNTLEEKQRKKALFIGMGSAFILRAAGILGITLLLDFYWVQILGALYLFYLCLRHLLEKDKPIKERKKQNFWRVVLAIEFTDIAFALDSILAAVAFISSYGTVGEINPKIWIVYIAAFIGIVGIRFCASFISKLLDCYPRLPLTAHLIVGWIGCKLLFDGLIHAFSLSPQLMKDFLPFFWGVLLVLFALGLTKKRKPNMIKGHEKER